MITHPDLTPEDLKDESLDVLNQYLRDLKNEVNRLGGNHGTITLNGPIDMGGNPITNLGSSADTSAALSQNNADPLYGKEAMKTVMEVTGNAMLQGTRRLNDPLQQEQASSFLRLQASIPPGTNTSTPTVVNSGGGTSTVTFPAGTVTFADRTVYGYATRSDVFTNPGVGTNYYYYYFRVSDHTLQFVGPFTANVSNNSMAASFDGRIYIGTAAVAAGGGGSAGGGGGFTGGGGVGGCVEKGTPVDYYPGTESVTEEEIPCNEWATINLEDGRALAMHPDTLVSVFIRAKDLEQGQRIEVDTGNWSSLKSLVIEERESVKIKRIVKPNGVYAANGVRVHNFKVQG